MDMIHAAPSSMLILLMAYHAEQAAHDASNPVNASADAYDHKSEMGGWWIVNVLIGTPNGGQGAKDDITVHVISPLF